MPVKHIAMPYLLQVSITLSSLIEPPGWAINSTPERFALSILSPNGKKASLPIDTPLKVLSHSRFSSRVRTSGFSLKKLLPYALSEHVLVIV